MLIAFPVLPLLASTMVSPGRSSPSRSARSIMYLAMRALIDPDGLRCSSLTHIPSTTTRGVLPIASRIVPPPRRSTPEAGSRAAPAAELQAGSRASAAESAPLMAFMPAPYVCAAGPGRRWVRCSTASYRPERPGRTSQQNRMKIRYSRRRDTGDHHGLPLTRGAWLQLTGQADFWHPTRQDNNAGRGSAQRGARTASRNPEAWRGSVEQRTGAGQRPRPGHGPVGDHEDGQPADRAVGPDAGHRLAFDVDDKVAVPGVEAGCDRGQPRPVECPGVARQDLDARTVREGGAFSGGHGPVQRDPAVL